VFEAAKRDPLTILSTVLMPLAGLLTAPFARPFRISRIFWTYVIPVIPFVLFFDGVVSCLRAYSQKELSVLVAQVRAENYVWQIGERSGGLAPVTFLIGYPGDAHTKARAALNSSEPSVVK
jgi:O-antigen/teichoic acid export membrane protein